MTGPAYWFEVDPTSWQGQQGGILPSSNAGSGNFTCLPQQWRQILQADGSRRSAVIYNDGPNPIFILASDTTPNVTAGNNDGASFKIPSGYSLTISHAKAVYANDPVGGSVVYVEIENGGVT